MPKKIRLNPEVYPTGYDFEKQTEAAKQFEEVWNAVDTLLATSEYEEINDIPAEIVPIAEAMVKAAIQVINPELPMPVIFEDVENEK